jgi:hypothetical protein
VRLFLFVCVVCCFQLSVGGIISSGSEIIDVPHHKRASAASTCYYGALVYFFTFLLSLGCFFGPLFLKRGGSNDLEALRNANRRGAAVPGSAAAGRDFSRI